MINLSTVEGRILDDTNERSVSNILDVTNERSVTIDALTQFEHRPSVQRAPLRLQTTEGHNTESVNRFSSNNKDSSISKLQERRQLGKQVPWIEIKNINQTSNYDCQNTIEVKTKKLSNKSKAEKVNAKQQSTEKIKEIFPANPSLNAQEDIS